MADKPTTVDDHMRSLSPEVRAVLQCVRELILDVVPDGVECISYGIPAIKLNGKLVIHFSGWKEHVSLYPVPETSAAVAKQMEPYIAGKGTLKFPIDKPVPYDLISKIAKAHLNRVTKSAKKPKLKST